MRIAYFISSLNNRGGLERIICDKANALAERGIEVHIVCHASTNPECAFELDPRVKTANLDTVFDPGTISLKQNPLRFLAKWMKWRRRFYRETGRYIRENHIDLTISSTYDTSLPFCFSSCPHIFESHAYRTHTFSNSSMPWVRKILARYKVRHAAAVVALTADDARLWPEAGRVEVIGNFTNIHPVAPYDPDTRRVLAAGRIDPQKGFDILVEAWSKVAATHPDWTLDIYGDNPNDVSARGRLQQLIDSKGLSDSIHLCGISHNMASVYADHSAFVLSSRYEGFGLVLLEAMTCGVPCVSFDCPYGPADIIDNGHDGLLVPFEGLTDHTRAEALADALDRMISDREMRMQMSHAAQLKAATFNRRAIIDRWLSLFNSLQ